MDSGQDLFETFMGYPVDRVERGLVSVVVFNAWQRWCQRNLGESPDSVRRRRRQLRTQDFRAALAVAGVRLPPPCPLKCLIRPRPTPMSEWLSYFDAQYPDFREDDG